MSIINQDDVAQQLVRIGIEEMHRFMYSRAVESQYIYHTFQEVILAEDHKELLKLTGWDISDYLAECERGQRLSIDTDYPCMVDAFAYTYLHDWPATKS